MRLLKGKMIPLPLRPLQRSEFQIFEYLNIRILACVKPLPHLVVVDWGVAVCGEVIELTRLHRGDFGSQCLATRTVLAQTPACVSFE